MTLQSPTSYQGGKARIAKVIVDKLLEHSVNGKFYDLCCGSGAISLELMNRGVPPTSITMCDAGPWGLFWKEIGEGAFDLNLFETMIKSLPDLKDIKDYMVKLAKKPTTEATTQTFLLLQASSFGAKPIWIENGIWRNCSFRSYWLPTATSNRRSPVNPMMPLPQTILERTRLLVEKCKGINGIYDKVENLKIDPEAIVYVDPPYQNTTPYGHDVDVVKLAKSLPNTVFVSEGYAIEGATHQQLAESKQRKKGGINGIKQVEPNAEYLNLFGV